MMGKEMRELDAWLAEHVFGQEVVWLNSFNDFHIIVARNLVDDIKHAYATVPRYTDSAFAEIKREIERRGWGWQCAYCQDGEYDFGIFNPNDSVIHALDGEEIEVSRILAVVKAKTEELAGCLAMKTAMEATSESL